MPAFAFGSQIFVKKGFFTRESKDYDDSGGEFRR
jgi:hypothetical protein